jgi:hypothetical protein
MRRALVPLIALSACADPPPEPRVLKIDIVANQYVLNVMFNGTDATDALAQRNEENYFVEPGDCQEYDDVGFIVGTCLDGAWLDNISRLAAGQVQFFPFDNTVNHVFAYAGCGHERTEIMIPAFSFAPPALTATATASSIDAAWQSDPSWPSAYIDFSFSLSSHRCHVEGDTASEALPPNSYAGVPVNVAVTPFLEPLSVTDDHQVARIWRGISTAQTVTIPP